MILNDTKAEALREGLPLISLVVAMARNRVIGRDGAMPWHLPADLAHFKRVTWGKPIIMGRRTYEAIGKALPGRRNIVISGSLKSPLNGVELAGGLYGALELCRDCTEVMIVGGGMLYAEALPLAQRLWVTIVEAEIPGDTWFPRWHEDEWRRLSCEYHPIDARHAYAMRFIELERINNT